MDLNSLWISVLIQAHKVTPKENYIKKAEIHYKNLEKKICWKKILSQLFRRACFS